MKATEQLKKEHNAVKVMLRVLDRICKKLEAGEEIDASHLEQMIDFFRTFVDKCHHTKEENMLFAAIQSTLDVSDAERMGALVKDHVSGRNYINELADAVKDHKAGIPDSSARIIKSARHYLTLLIQHIDIEDNILYPIADQKLSEKKQQELYDDFEKLEEEEIGHGKHEEFHRMIDELKAIYLT